MMLASKYKYTLDTSSKKYRCPNCDKKTLVRFIDSETGNLMPDEFGRCDREQKCGYLNIPKQSKKVFFIKCLNVIDYSSKALKITDSLGYIHFAPVKSVYESSDSGLWLYEWFLVDSKINYAGCNYKCLDNDAVSNTTKVKKYIEPEPSFIPLELLDKMYCDEDIVDNLIQFLDSKFSFMEVQKAKKDYFITGTNLKWNYTTVFWQIDDKERIRTAKLMLYNASNGKRIKEPYPHQNWLHSVLKTKDFNLSQCLFGLHLVNDDYSKSIAIVESEKTAIIMSIVADEFIWLATGGKSMLKIDLLKPIKHRTIILYPDKSVYKEWKKKADSYNADGYRIAVTDILEKSDLLDGSDMADLIINNSKAGISGADPAFIKRIK